MIRLIAAVLSASTAAASCPSLQDLFSKGLYEHNLYDHVVKSSHIVGDRDETAEYTYSDPGDQDLWHDNPLTYQIDGNVTNSTAVGTSSGLCNLLPPAGNVSQCLTVFTFQEHGMIVMSSLWPNNIVERGQLIIVGGTNCFENVAGTISVLATDGSWEYFEYQLVDDGNQDNKSKCNDVNLLDMFNTTLESPTLYEVEKNGTFLPAWSNANGLTAGDRDLWHDNWFLKSNNTNLVEDDWIGFASGSCTWLNTETCIGIETFEFNNNNRITQIMFNVSHQEIMGGTNCFLGEKGGMSMKNLESGMYKYTLDPVVKRSDCNNVTLDYILSTGLYEELENNHILSASGGTGTGQDIGDTTLWIDNPIFIEAIGKKVGTTTGMCIVLSPGDNGTSLCLMKLHLTENLGDEMNFGGGSVTFMGLVSIANDVPGEMAVVSGTGCFANPTVKTLYYTRSRGGFATIQASVGDGDDSTPNSCWGRSIGRWIVLGSVLVAFILN